MTTVVERDQRIGDRPAGGIDNRQLGDERGVEERLGYLRELEDRRAAILASIGLEVLGLGPIDSPTLGMTLYWVNFNAAMINGWWWWWNVKCSYCWNFS